MNFLLFLGALLVFGVPIVLIVMLSGLKGQIEVLNRRIMQLSQDMKTMSKPVSNTVAEPEPAKTIVEQVETVEPAAMEQVAEPEPTVMEQVAEPVVVQQPPVCEKQEKPAMIQPHPQAVSKEGFNFERFIGENLINKIGIGVLVIGIGLFVKYAIDNEWINETARVIIGFLCGGVLLASAYRFRKTYRAFSSVLAGGAMALFYFTVAIAFREYHLFGQTASFLMMVAITGFSVWLSILYNRRELAVLSLIGGILTPFMVSRGDGNYHVLFTYIAILNIGMLALSLRKQWKELIIISFIGTWLIFWLYFLRDVSMFRGGNLFKSTTIDIARDLALLLYASVFYIIFLLMPLIQVFRDKDPSKDHALHIIMLVANSFFYLLAGVLLLQRMEADSFKGLLMALLAVVNAVVAALLHNNQKDKVLFHLFAGLTISFVTLAVPMQFDGNNITLFWATEAVLLMWLFHKSSAVIYYCGSLILLTFAFFSVCSLHHLQDLNYDTESHIRALEGSIFINRYFITRLYASLAFVVSGLLLRRHYKEHTTELRREFFNWIPMAIGTVAAGMLFYTGSRELYIYTDTNCTSFWEMAYFMIFASILTVITGRDATTCRFRFIVVIGLWAIGCLWYWLKASGLHHSFNLLVYNHQPYSLSIVLYWIGFAGLCGLFTVFSRIFYRKYQLKSPSGKTMMWIFNVAAIITLSIAMIEVIHQITSHNDLYISNKASITVLWSLCAFIQMWLGMRLRYKTLRIISLSLLGLVLCKLFLYDLSSVSQGAKIVAFVVLGVVLLVLSFLYQKLKKILFEE